MRGGDVRSQSGLPFSGAGASPLRGTSVLQQIARRTLANRDAMIRGQSLRGLLAAVAARFTAAELAEVLARLPEEARTMGHAQGFSAQQSIAARIGGTSWYPV